MDKFIIWSICSVRYNQWWKCSRCVIFVVSLIYVYFSVHFDVICSFSSLSLPYIYFPVETIASVAIFGEALGYPAGLLYEHIGVRPSYLISLVAATVASLLLCSTQYLHGFYHTNWRFLVLYWTIYGKLLHLKTMQCTPLGWLGSCKYRLWSVFVFIFDNRKGKGENKVIFLLIQSRNIRQN